MATFKNLAFTKRDFKTTNIVFCQSETLPDALLAQNWASCNESEINIMNCIHLYTQAGVRYFGYL